MRLSTTFRDALANGDFVTLANSLNYFNGVGTGASGTVPVSITGERGTVMKRANLGFNVPGGTTIPGGPVVPAGLFPANWISANPQFGTGTGIGAGANYWSNNGHIQIQLPSAPRYDAADSWNDSPSHLHLLEIDANSVGFIRRGKWIEYRANLHESSGTQQGLPT